MIPSLQSELLSAAPALRHGFYTRQGGVSQPPYESLNVSESSHDDGVKVQQNRQLIAQDLGIEVDHLITCRQVHEVDVAVIHQPCGSGESQRAEADGMVTDRPGLALGVLTADCAPVLLADPDAGVIGAAHAGWRSAFGGIIEQTISRMERLGADREKIIAAIGPCLWQDSYEVGPDFPIPFYIEDESYVRFFKPSPRRAHSMFDLPGFVAWRLQQAGVARFDPSPSDTLSDEARFFSHRRGFLRSQKEEGRMLSVIMMA